MVKDGRGKVGETKNINIGGGRKGKKELRYGLSMSHDECDHYVLQKCTNAKYKVVKGQY